jgi:Tfp pilus assembly protein PilX
MFQPQPPHSRHPTLSTLRARLGREDGISLVIALGVLVVLTALSTSAMAFTRSNQHNAVLNQADLQARTTAEAGLNGVYSLLSRQSATGGNPSTPSLLGCAASTTLIGASDCSSPQPLCIPVAGACTPGVAKSQGTASVYGYFSGTNPQTFFGVSVPASTWLFLSTGYAANPDGSVDGKMAMATAKISPLGAGQVAAVWNHVFLTALLGANACQLNLQGNTTSIDIPIYANGNVCLGSNGSGVTVAETAGKPIDLMIGGKLVLLGGSKIGADSLHPITSGVVVGGCTTVSVSAGTMPCTPTSFSYWVKSVDTFVPNEAPALNATQMATNYASFDPGPMHPCQAGTVPAPPAASAFDSMVSGGTVEPDTSGSVSSGSAFELTPNFSYSCVSQNGASVGQLTWDNTAKLLTINGSIFFDSNVTISQSANYTGAAVIEAAGTIAINGNSTKICAVYSSNSNDCDWSNWQGTTSNRSMLTLVSLTSTTPSISFTNNSQSFQGSLWTQPAGSVTFVKNGDNIEGPISVGTFDSSFNNASFQPMPVITNMPVGAPLPPNTGATVSTYTILK